MLRFENPEFLVGLWIIPFLILLLIFQAFNRKRSLKKWGNLELVKKLFPQYSRSKFWIKGIFKIIAFASLVIAIANPQIGSKLSEAKREGIDLMILLDVSNSMLSEDVKPNRLELSKQYISRIISKSEQDRIGLIVFAGRAYTQVPLTSDHSALKLFLSSIEPGMIGNQGTLIAEALNLATNSFPKNDEKSRAVLLITDGEDHEENAIKAAKSADSAGIIIHSLGVGSEEGGPIPIVNNGENLGYKKDQTGSVIVSKLNPQILSEIATEANGKAFFTYNSGDVIGDLLSELQKIQKQKFGSQIFSEYEDRFYYFAALSLFFLLLDLMLSDRKSKIWKKLNLFNEKKEEFDYE
jgi:Ca-activated chloride channel homolog